MAWAPDVATSSVFATLILQAIVGAVLYLLFEMLRSQREVFYPKKRSKPTRCPGPALSTSVLGWIQPTLEVSDDETLRFAGLDGYILLRFLRLCATATLCCGAFALVFLLPIYSTGFGDDEVVGIDRYTIANVATGGDRLWAAMLCTWGFSLVLLYLLYKEYENFVELRREFLLKGDVDLPTQPLYSVVLENLPKELRSTPKLLQLIDQIFPGEAVSAVVAVETQAIAAAVEERKVYLANLEKAVALYEAGGRADKPMVSLTDGKVAMCRGEETVEAIPYYMKQVHRLNQCIEELKQQAQALADGLNPISSKKTTSDEGEDTQKPVLALTSTGFVTFRSKKTQAVATQVPTLSGRYPTLRAFLAPSPRNILWQNVGTSLQYIRSAALFTKAILYTGLMFWAVILAFVAAISSLSNLEKYLPFLKELDPVSYALLEGQLPVIALIVFIGLLPTIFAAISTYIERRKTISDVRMEVFTWFFMYQIANVYLLLLAGSIFGALADAISNPMSIVSLLANSLPGVSTFFLNLLITFLLSGIPMALLRIGPAAIYKLYRLCFNERKLTRRDLIEGPLASADIDYATVLPGLLYVLCIAQTYWVIAPIVGFVAGLLFAAKYVVFKYQLCYVIVNKNETGGLYFYKLFNYSMVGLMTSALTMVGYMGIKEAPAQAILLAPLLLVIYAVWCHTEEAFRTRSLGLAYEEALRADLPSPVDTDACSAIESTKAAVEHSSLQHPVAAAEKGVTAPAELVSSADDNSVDLTAQFQSDFFLHPALRGNTAARPEVYRHTDTSGPVPLFTPEGWLQDAYFASHTLSLEELATQLDIQQVDTSDDSYMPPQLSPNNNNSNSSPSAEQV